MYDNEFYDYWGLRESSNQHSGDLWTMKMKTSLAYLNLVERCVPQGLPSPQLLDIGCAHGFMLEAAQQRGFQASGIDISPAVSVARQQGFNVYDRPLHELGLSANTFDIITLIDVLEHVPDPRRLMQEVCRILKPKGAVLIVTPDIGSWIARIMKDSWPHYKSEHIFYFNRRSLCMLLRKTGFSVEHVGRAFKYLNLTYILGHFQKYSPGWVTTLLTSLHSVLPLALTRTTLRFQTEMLSIARPKTAA